MPQRPTRVGDATTKGLAASSSGRRLAPVASRGAGPRARSAPAATAIGTTPAPPRRPASRPASRRAPASSPAEPSTRELILLSAAAAFAERGYCGVNLADVVEELGFTKGALYFYFPNKESLASEIVARHFQAWEGMLPAAIEQTDDYLAALVEITHRVADAFRKDPIARAGTRLSSERNLINAQLPEPFVGWIGKLTDLIRLARQAGEIREEVEPKVLARLVVSFFYGAQAISEQLTGRDDLHKRLDEFWGLILPQVRVPARASRPTGRLRSR